VWVGQALRVESKKSRNKQPRNRNPKDGEIVDFKNFATNIRNRFNALTSDKNRLVYRMGVSGDDLWDTYLKSFPEGTNPMFRQRTEHDCSCCKSFIRSVGGLVTLDENGEIQTIWDEPGSDPTYKVVSAALAAKVRSGKIENLFLATEPTYGVESNVEKREGMPEIIWHHFNCRIPAHLLNKEPGTKLAEATSAHQVFSRGLEEFGPGVLDTVSDLIESNGLYRGEEHLPAVQGFVALKRKFDETPEGKRDSFLWNNVFEKSSRFRNTVIGTLCQDLAEGMDVEKAVARFEKKVAPENYKRTSAPITSAMIEKALLVLRTLELESALQRRHATIRDVKVSDVLFVDRSARPLMKDPLADLLLAEVKPSKKKVQLSQGGSEISGEEFFRDVLPGAESVELHLQRSHLPNFMSLTAPVEEGADRLFQWDNGFAWCYSGGMADSAMRQAVQEKGGRVDGALRFTHSWNHEGQRNASLMDLHVFMPGNGSSPDNGVHDTYGGNHRVGWNSRNDYYSGGTQDVDYVSAAPDGYIPVENITFPSLAKMPQGQYICKIHNWNLRTPTKGGFRAEIEFGGNVFEYEYPKPLGNKEWMTVAVVTLHTGEFTIEHRLEPKSRQVEKWGLKTETLVPVDTVMLSPNFWGGQAVGNKHYLFMLRGCKNSDSVRGFFNEFLRPDLTPHRKVFEVLAGKTKVSPAEDQLSGVGFSSTRHDRATFTVRKNNATRTYEVQF
jgi:hypothetical protein